MGGDFENKGALTSTVVVAASDSLNQAAANYICDGANDEVEIQAALNALPASGGEVVLLDGTFSISDNIDLDSYQTLRGQGTNTVLRYDAVGKVIRAWGGLGTEKQGVVIADLKIDGNSKAGQVGVYLYYVQRSYVLNLFTVDCPEAGITVRYSDYVVVQGNICDDCHEALQIFTDNSYCDIVGNICLNCDASAIYVTDSVYCTVTANIVLDGTGTTGIYVGGGLAYHNVVADNVVYNCTGVGIHIESSFYTIVTGNMVTDSSTDGIRLGSGSDFCIVSNNISEGNGYHGIYIYDSEHCTITGNNCRENSQDTTNTYDDINLNQSNYNSVQNNICRAGALAAVPRYGIYNPNGANWNVIIDNDLYDDGFGTAPYFCGNANNARHNVFVVPFVNGTNPNQRGFLVGAGGEYADTYLRLPDKVVQVVGAKVYANVSIAEVDHMRAEFVIWGAADNETINTHDGSIANHPSTSVNFAGADNIYWTITTAGLLAMKGGDSIQFRVLHEVAGGLDCATDAYFRTAEIEYV